MSGRKDASASVCDEYCRDCKYSILDAEHRSTGLLCDYLAINRKRRCCKAGTGCKKKVKRA